MTKVSNILILLIALSNAAFSEQKGTETLNLDKSIQLAVENNLNIKISDSDVDIMSARHRKAKSPLYPQIRFRFILPFVERESGVFADQLIWDFWKTPSLVRASSASLQSSRHQRSATINDVILNTKIAYYNLLINQNILETNKNELKEFEKKFEQTENFVELGRKSKLDLAKARVDIGHAKLNLLNSEKKLELARANFINLLGMDEEFNFELKDESGYESYDWDIKSLTQYALKNRPELKRLLSDESSQRSTLKAAKRDHYPKVVARAAYRFDGDGATGPDFIAGIGLNFPLFQGFSKVAQVNENKAALRKITTEIEIFKRNTIMDIKRLYLDIKYSRQKIDVTTDGLASAEQTLELTEELYKAGRKSMVDLLEAKSLYSRSKTDNLASIYNYKVALAKLEWATGEQLNKEDKTTDESKFIK
ncbi:MAG: TolC family protein [Candidatus Dadabacteria bacterium]|nr:TolC family protein [Candidatus Dadabacteria bacterium]NIS07239.1 TolC family protein [Candidatus Dadabacteria bacterium]NIV40946.1 TolC family protein [Candidatus Dadabacteria bacterium]NIX14378.1 TolC family protein [Candidatus Dadabacteria bacterium]NIY20896.1 TolC family protein [Candidatus Dadabacteria bacterium]